MIMVKYTSQLNKIKVLCISALLFSQRRLTGVFNDIFGL